MTRTEDVASGAALEGFALPDGGARGKAGEEIPLYGRIVALADVYDAQSSARIYKEAWQESDVLSTIEQEAGRQFDPELVEIFLDNVDEIISIQERFRDDEANRFS